MADVAEQWDDTAVIDETEQVLRELRAAFELSSDRAVVRRALVLARMIAHEMNDEHKVTVVGRDGQPFSIVLNR